MSGFAALAAAISSGVEQATRIAKTRKAEVSIKSVKIDKREAKRAKKAEAAAATLAAAVTAAPAAAAPTEASTEGDATPAAEKPKKKRKASRRGGGGKKTAEAGSEGAATAAGADNGESRKKAKLEGSAAVALPTPVGFTRPAAAPASAPMAKGRLPRAKLPGACFAFQKGECDRGDSCRYAHGDGGGGGPKKPAKPMSVAAAASMTGVVKISKEVVPGTAYVRKIPDGATKTQVTEALERFGTVTSCRLVMDKETRQPNGVAFADFADDEDIMKVVAACQSYKRGKGNGVPCCGGRLQVDPALTTTGLSAIVNGTTARSIKPVQKVKPKDRARPKPCHDFEKGECVRGDRCRFFHDPDAAEARAAGKKRENKGPCFAFKKGECNRGDDCKFSHGATPGGAAAAAAGRTTARLTGSGRPAKKAGICFAFQKGECDRGGNCKFNHVSQH